MYITILHYAGYIMLYAYVWSRLLEPGVLPRSLLFLLIDRRFRRLLGRAPSRMEVDGHYWSESCGSPRGTAGPGSGVFTWFSFMPQGRAKNGSNIDP